MTKSRGFEGQLESDRYCDTLLKSTVGNADSTHSTKIFSEESLQHSEALQFMRGIMDEFTHLKNYDVPVDPGTYYKHLFLKHVRHSFMSMHVFPTQGMFWGKGFQVHLLLQNSSSLWQRNMTHTCPETGSLPCQKFGQGRSYVSSMAPVTWRPTCSSKVFFGKPFTTPLISTVRNTRPNLSFQWLIAKEANRHTAPNQW